MEALLKFSLVKDREIGALNRRWELGGMTRTDVTIIIPGNFRNHLGKIIP